MSITVVSSFIGALGIGSLITQYVTGSQARREVRGAVLKQLAEVEKARWAGGEDDPGFQGFRTQVHSLETAALIARIPRRAVAYYLIFAQAARGNTQNFLEEHGWDEDFGVLLDTRLSKLVTGAALTLTRVAWSPWFGRMILPWQFRRLRKQIAACKEEDRQRIIKAQDTYGILRGLPAPDSDQKFQS